MSLVINVIRIPILEYVYTGYRMIHSIGIIYD